MEVLTNTDAGAAGTCVCVCVAAGVCVVCEEADAPETNPSYVIVEGFTSAEKSKWTPSGSASMAEKIGLVMMPLCEKTCACSAIEFTLPATPVIVNVTFDGFVAS